VQRSAGARLCFGDGAEAARARALLMDRGVACELAEDVPDLERIFLDLTGRALRDEAGS
jgi:hypothetical protein